MKGLLHDLIVSFHPGRLVTFPVVSTNLDGWAWEDSVFPAFFSSCEVKVGFSDEVFVNGCIPVEATNNF